MNRINVAVTGYVGTGSSAVIDLLKEFDDCGVALGQNREYEHIPFYADNGLFDLGAILKNVNSSLRSDTAISSFIESMKWLNENDFGWFGSYKMLMGDKFEKAYEQFVSEISIPITGKTYSHYKRVRYSMIKVLIQLAAKLLYKRPITKWGRVYVVDKKKMYFSMPYTEEFNVAARKFVNEYFEICSEKDKRIMIYDHLLWPQHTKLLEDYFDSNFKMIVVMRDARDLFTLNKYYWYKPPLTNGDPLFPINPVEFSDYWKRVRSFENIQNSDKVLYVQFEDLIYNYEDTVVTIMDFLGLNASQHVNKKKYFNPEKSIKNTQTFTIDSDWNNEVSIISSIIPEYTYPFPHTINTSLSEMFDTTSNSPIPTNKKD